MDEKIVILSSSRPLLAGEKAIVCRAVLRIADAIGPGARLFEPYVASCRPDPSRPYYIHSILPDPGEPRGLALDSVDMHAGDPENKMDALTDRLIAGLPARIGLFYGMQAAGGIDLCVLAQHTETNLTVRVMRAYDIRENMYFMGLTIAPLASLASLGGSNG